MNGTITKESEETAVNARRELTCTYLLNLHSTELLEDDGGERIFLECVSMGFFFFKFKTVSRSVSLFLLRVCVWLNCVSFCSPNNPRIPLFTQHCVQSLKIPRG